VRWRNEPATSKQIDYAKSLARKTGGYDLVDWYKSYTKGEMTDMIDHMKEELGMITDSRPNVYPDPTPPYQPVFPPVTPANQNLTNFVGVLTVTFSCIDKDENHIKLMNLLKANGYKVHAFEITEL